MSAKPTRFLGTNLTSLPKAHLCALSTLLLGAAASAANPYPASLILQGISWNEASKQRYAADSDLWDSAWASDDNVYAGWGD